MTQANLSWHDGIPKSERFEDFYFNTIDAAQESLYVFIDSNQIAEKISSKTKSISIAETGFGSGLNFLTTLNLLNKSSREDINLRYISAEKHPLSKSDLKKALLNFPELADLATQLIDQYPEHASKLHNLYFNNGNTILTLLIDDAANAFKNVRSNIDAWYLDGFSPAKNPDMWSPELFLQIARLSRPGTTFSTFTSAGKVRKGLQSVGFDVRKQPGFGKKREMSLGTFIENKASQTNTTPWFTLPQTNLPEEVTIIGGGLSGCSTAYSLAQRDIKVTILEKEAELASAGSGNKQGALYAKLPVTPTKQGELHLSGFLYTVNFLKQNDPEQSFWSQCGVAQLATKGTEQKRQQELSDNNHYPDTLVQLKTADELSAICGSKVAHDGLFFPDAGWVSPVDFCHFLTNHPNITVEKKQINSIKHADNEWMLTDTESKHSHCTHLIICNAELANQFSTTDHLPLKAIRGQVSITPKNAPLPPLKTVICGDGYISPAQNDQFCFGATFDLKGKQRDVTASDHNKNLQKLSAALPEFHQQLTEQNLPLQGRTAFRCSTPDYMPVVGPAPVYDQYVNAFGRLRKDKNWRFDGVKASHHPNLYINTGHGSKGLITCPIASELLASMICNEPLPLPKNLIDAINPSRFIIKNLIKQAI